MPRIYDSASGPVDYCRRCFPKTVEAAEAKHKFPVLPTDNDGRGCCFSYDDSHPGYDGEDYTCEKCGRLLTGEDD